MDNTLPQYLDTFPPIGSHSALEIKKKTRLSIVAFFFYTISLSEQIHLIDFFGYFELGGFHYFLCLFPLQMLAMQELHTALQF